MVLATIFVVTRVGEFGRRTLLFLGISIVIVTCAIWARLPLPGVQRCQRGARLVHRLRLAAGMGVRHLLCPHAVRVSENQVDFGSVAWLLVSEVFPQRVRGLAEFTTAISDVAWNFVVTSAEPTLGCVPLPSGVFVAFMLLALLFVKYTVPQTKGETLEEMEAAMPRSDTEVEVVSARNEV